MVSKVRKIAGAVGMALLAGGATAWAGGRVLRPIPAVVVASAIGVGIGYLAWPKKDDDDGHGAKLPAGASSEKSLPVEKGGVS